ncbi:MAG: hypothetical protein Q9226_002370 [Calogaya cf. arnoldii]
MAKSARKLKAKRVHTPDKENTQRVKQSRVTKPARTRRSSPRNILAPPSKHGMRTRAKATLSSDGPQPFSTPPTKSIPPDDAYYTSLSQEMKKTPKTPKSRKTPRTKKAPQNPETPRYQSPANGKTANITFVWGLLSIDRSFWDPIRETSSSQASASPGRSFGGIDIDNLMKRINRQVSHEFINLKFEPVRYISSPSPSGHDPLEQIPITDEEKAELQLALFPSLQHLVELTKRQPWRINTNMCYIEQFNALKQQLQDIWQFQGHAKVAPILFQLEPWNGAIVSWRSSYYTNSDERFKASVVDEHFQTWRAEMPAPSPVNDYNMPDIDDSDLEMQSLDLPHYMDSSSPLYNRASPTPRAGTRRVMSAIYDKNRDIGFLPTPRQIRSYQNGETSSTTLPGLGMSDPGIIDTDSSDPIQEAYFRGSDSIRIFDEGNVTPPHASDPMGYTSSQASESSDKENDPRVLARVLEEQRLENMRMSSPSNSQDNIDPADETWARNERLGDVWDMLMGE